MRTILLLVPIVATSASNSDRNHVRREDGRNLGFLDNVWNTAKEMMFPTSLAARRRDWIQPKQTQEMFDVVIIGAGMAGLAAAKEIQDIDSSLSYVILESTGAVGGRVRSVSFGGVVVEDGANWLYDGNFPTWNLANAQGVVRTESVYSDFTMYDTTVSDGLGWRR